MPLGADRGVRALPLRVRGWAAGPGLLHDKGEGERAQDRVDLGDSLVKSKGPVSIAVDASGINQGPRRRGLDPEGLEGEEGVPEDGMEYTSPWT